MTLYEATSRQRVLTFAGYQGEWNPLNFFPTSGVATAIHTVAFSPDGAWLAAGTKDGRVRLWRFVDLVHGSDKPQQLRPQDLDLVWSELTSPDPLRGSRALAQLTSSPELALPHVKTRLTPTPHFDAVRVRKLMTELDHDEFTIREAATDQLEKYSEAIRPLLRESLREGKVSAEAASRMRRLVERLDGLEPPPERLRESRVVQSLEWMATPEARVQLERLATGQPGSPLTVEAVQALARLGKRVRP